MSKAYKKAAALALAAAMVLGGCSNGKTEPTPDAQKPADPQKPAETQKPAEDKKAEEITELVIPKLVTRELETFVIVHSQRAEDGENLTNLYDALLEVDEYGRMIPGIAESWGSEDGGVTWKFNMRKGVNWVDVNANVKQECTSADFITGLEFVLNFHKNDSANTSMPMEMIKGAAEYYEWTKTLTPEEGKALGTEKFLEMVGMEAPDPYTVIYTCLAPKPYFDTLANYSCLYPVPQALIDEVGGVDNYRAINNENMWYNGPYTMTTYIQGNEKVFTKNPEYWDKDCKLFDMATFKMVDSSDVAFQQYKNGELDQVDLTESMLKTIHDNPSDPLYNQLTERRPSAYSYQFHWNFDKHFADGSKDVNWNTAIANEAFRKSLYFGLDLTEYYKRTNAINPLKCENDFYTINNFVYTSDGTDYIDLVRERLGMGKFNGEKMVRLDQAKGEEYKKQAIEELTALGVTFPVEIDYFIAGANQSALDSALVLQQAFANSLGDDYVKLDINTYVSSLSKEVRDPKLQSFFTNGWGADYNDPQNYLVQETYGNDNAWYSSAYSNINDVEETEATKDLIAAYKEFTEMVTKADAICDNMDARYNAFADAEAFMLDHAFVMPCNYAINWQLTHINMYSYSSTKMKNWETSKEPYTTADYDVFVEKFNNGK